MVNQMAMQAALSATSAAASAAGFSWIAVMGVSVAGASAGTVQGVSKLWGRTLFSTM